MTTAPAARPGEQVGQQPRPAVVAEGRREPRRARAGRAWCSPLHHPAAARRAVSPEPGEIVSRAASNVQPAHRLAAGAAARILSVDPEEGSIFMRRQESMGRGSAGRARRSDWPVVPRRPPRHRLRPPRSTAGMPGRGDGGSNARSEAASGGASGTVDSVSTPSFTMTTSAGQQVTVNEASSTTYQDGATSLSAGDVTTGETVLVLGMTSGTTITAAQVIVQPDDDGGAAASSEAGVIPFQRGTPSRRIRSVRSRRTTPRGTGRSSVALPRIRRRKPRWLPTREASSTASCS